MYALKSRNAELNAYINNFLDLHYQPTKMLWWRILILCCWGLVFTIQDYQYHGFYLQQWFSWTPFFILVAGLLTINFQSLYLGSMSFQYRHHDTAFVIARKFLEFDYALLIRGLENKLTSRKLACRRSQMMMVLLLVGVLILIRSKLILWQLFANGQIQLLFLFSYITLMLSAIFLAAMGSFFILTSKRELELLELSLFWLKLASTIKYIG